MLDSFEKESKLHERRAARQRQMRLMEEAASGLPTTGDDNDDVDRHLGLAPPTMADFVIDDDIDDVDDEDAGPPSVFTDASAHLRASAHLWTSKTSKDMGLDAEKIGFITGDDSPRSAWSSARRTAEKSHDESRELILMASRRLANSGGDSTPPAGNTTGSLWDRSNSGSGSSTFQIDINEINQGEDFRQRSSIKLPTCCLLHRRAIGVTVMVLTFFTVLLAVTEPMRKHSKDTTGVSQRSPWADYEPLKPPPDDLNNEKFNRIKDRILEHGISHASTLEETFTPQYKALNWIVNDDLRRLDLPPRDDEAVGMNGADIDAEQQLFQRYALAVLWFQTNDLQIVQQSMTGRDVEDVFETPFDPLALTKNQIQWKDNYNWMSNKGLCMWHGVTCHPREGNDGDDEQLDEDFYVAILNLTSNNVYGIVPREVYTGFGKLKALDLSKNELEGTVGRELGGLENLEDLFLFENNFSGELPDDIGKLKNLYNLYINDNKFRGRIPSEMGMLTKLRGASMFNNTFEGRIPDSLGNLKDMIALYLDENELSGQVPTAFGLMSSMIDLRLRDNKLSGSIPTELGALTNLETLYMDTNPKIAGNIPTELSNLLKLNELHLYQMDLSGPLPSMLGLLTGLVYLYLDTNQLTGSIPEEWGEMRDLEELFLTENILTGHLPNTLRGMKSLQTFRAANNELSGPIPSDMGAMLKLEYVYLEGNDFSGEVPSQLGELTKLKLMHLHNSNLSGEIPPEICKLTKNFLLLDLTADCEDVTCSCCNCSPKI